MPKEEQIEIFHLFPRSDQPGWGAEGLERLDQAADVPTAIVDDADC